jgi:hypothetical protein
VLVSDALFMGLDAAVRAYLSALSRPSDDEASKK